MSTPRRLLADYEARNRAVAAADHQPTDDSVAGEEGTPCRRCGIRVWRGRDAWRTSMGVRRCVTLGLDAARGRE